MIETDDGFATFVWRTMTRGGINLYRGGYFGKQDPKKYFVDKPNDISVFRQLLQEAGLPAQLYVHEDNVDRLNAVASRRDIPLILNETSLPDTGR